MFDLLRGVRVLELAALSPDAVGMHLADLGAEVIKIEQPPHGDVVRQVGPSRMGGVSLMHLRWNRGKQSVALNLKHAEGRRVFLELAARSNAVVDGLRAGAADRSGVGYEALRQVNPAIVYCVANGTGQSGPYRDLATHGLAYDAYGGLAPPAYRPDGTPHLPQTPPIGIHAGPLYAALAITAALVRAATHGTGQRIEVSQMDCAAVWQADGIDAALNRVEPRFRGMEEAVRYQYYRCQDDRFVILQASEEKFWRNFCRGVGREDLLDPAPQRAVGEHARGDETLRRELAAIFARRPRADWVRFFAEHDVAGGPVNSPEELPDDPHFRARDLTFAQTHPEVGECRWLGPPIKLAGQPFAAAPAPSVGQHTREVLAQLLGYDDGALEALGACGAI